MTDEEAIRARCDAATRGPWQAGNNGQHQPRLVWINGPDLLKSVYGTDAESWAQVVADAEFVAHAREDVPALLAEVERLRAEIKRLEAAYMAELPY